MIERTANLYWAHARDSQIRTPAHRTVDFAESLAGFYSRRRRLQCCYLAVSGLALYVGVESALWLGWLKSLIPASEVTEVRQALLLSLGGCLVLAVALFDASAAISLGSLSAVVSSFATAGLVSLLTVAVVTTWFPPSAAPLTLCVGSCISAALCRRQLRVALQRAAHRYFAIL